MSYQDFKEQIEREIQRAYEPSIPFGQPGSSDAGLSDPFAAPLLAKIHFRLCDDPIDTIQAVEQLRDDPKITKEMREFYARHLQDLKNSLHMEGK